MKLNLPRRGVTTLVLALTQAVFTHCVTINKLGPNIVAKSRLELQPLTIDAFLYDVIRISAPIINEQALYYIHNPAGDAMKLDIKSPKLRDITVEQEMEPLVTKFVNRVNPIITQSNNYDVFSIYKRSSSEDNFEQRVDKMEGNDFMIGPLSDQDHGNWVLSVYTKDYDDNWIELFQVITVTITEYVPLTPRRPELHLGQSFNLRFVFPIPSLQSCELVAPRSTFDRMYSRQQINLTTCGFSLKNVTKEDSGIWRIIGVGNIVYIGETLLTVLTNGTARENKPQLGSLNYDAYE